ncbi:hypothetical protein FOXG_19262 [Fusarium oxysporum f. sp. lycopersici 4287]|uniref:Uncharacterized protein n=2 Tax=Fusarium oxysporum f. sp. lycopersici (strain 4287 / CBS 123668 / FGSC 9935 / NRRL 34936) TaxID=426428 RepID=A0A0J9WLS7_FUSO4|nr:hypothetical protein FOXG_19262 [Fusarium oxysporum f. sp. lycopersici 4287]KNB04302.1 hypothetical protein FOXG_19262 [Fusarium oxysporum f. sp. lycopersici 4287]
MTTLNNSPPSQHDQIPKHPMEESLEWLPIIIIIMVFLILDILFMYDSTVPQSTDKSIWYQS